METEKTKRFLKVLCENKTKEILQILPESQDLKIQKALQEKKISLMCDKNISSGNIKLKNDDINLIFYEILKQGLDFNTVC